MAVSQYRPEIDGLRAIAVLNVVLYHAGLGLPGGYVGVDIFFVISGYLITNIIQRESNEQRFSLTQFWMRRIRRILPAASVVVLSTFVISYFILDPNSLRDLGLSGIAHATMLANVFFLNSNGYFAESSELKPLLHTWSLSVEEQFYILFPILLIFLLKQKTVYAVSTLTLITIVSLCLSGIGVFVYPDASFYLLPTRAWELAAGALLALTEHYLAFKQSAKQILGFAGFGAIICSTFLYMGTTPFPGFAAILPVGGAVAIIATNSDGQNIIGRVLSQKPLVLIGLISYSLYLWHWPILALSKHGFIDDSLTLTLGLILVAGILSFLTWKTVEIPFRKSRRLSRPQAVFAFGGIISILTISTGMLLYISNSYQNQSESELAILSEDIHWNGSEYLGKSGLGVLIGDTSIESRQQDFVLWGDSHGMALGDLINSSAKEQGLKGIALLSAGIAPVTGLWKPLKGAAVEKQSTELNRARLDWILQSGIKDVILVARWTGLIEGLLDSEIDVKHGRPANFNMVVDTQNVTPSKVTSRDAFFRQFERMLRELSASEIRVWLLVQVPSASISDVAREYYLALRYPLLNLMPPEFDTERTLYEKSRARIMDVFEEMRSDYLHILDPVDAFYKDSNELRLYSSRAFYRDEDHLTRFGAEHYLRPMFLDIFSYIREAKNKRLVGQ
jgi:peptidoglycan/LPS O-acetylase OafA/YrhL